MLSHFVGYAHRPKEGHCTYSCTYPMTLTLPLQHDFGNPNDFETNRFKFDGFLDGWMDVYLCMHCSSIL